MLPCMFPDVQKVAFNFSYLIMLDAKSLVNSVSVKCVSLSQILVLIRNLDEFLDNYFWL